MITSASATAGTATATAAGLAAGCLAAASTSALVPVGSAGLVAAGNTASEVCNDLLFSEESVNTFNFSYFKVAKQSAKNAAQTGLRYNPIGADVFIETGKVVGSNSTRLAGNVIVGVSAAFLVWDAIDLGINIVDLVRISHLFFENVLEFQNICVFYRFEKKVPVLQKFSGIRQMSWKRL